MKISEYKDTNELLKRLNACKYSVEKTTKRQVTYNAAINDACRIVDALPAADVIEIQHGRWVDYRRMGVDGTFHWFRCCSNCRYEREDDNEDKDTPYCPNCGAKMDLEGDVE